MTATPSSITRACACPSETFIEDWLLTRRDQLIRTVTAIGPDIGIVVGIGVGPDGDLPHWLILRRLGAPGEVVLPVDGILAACDWQDAAAGG